MMATIAGGQADGVTTVDNDAEVNSTTNELSNQTVFTTPNVSGAYLVGTLILTATPSTTVSGTFYCMCVGDRHAAGVAYMDTIATTSGSNQHQMTHTFTDIKLPVNTAFKVPMFFSSTGTQAAGTIDIDISYTFTYVSVIP
jgi:hypothetical protein